MKTHKHMIFWALFILSLIAFAEVEQHLPVYGAINHGQC
jgi:hypothetical protein